ncbi:hypothetical protein T05_11477 [Trichinella murrelli]|uniref:Uncharacterized protein n=1 Tax=Trichinella murrelli TaxID=144512 RepID=A0A0V0TNY6_9BILA|nr:hypothetical protein T05_11477 [Trichinella murrelli]
MAEISFIRHAACPVFYLFNSMFSCIETGSVKRTEQNIYRCVPGCERISCKCFLIALQPFVHSFVTFKLIIEIEDSEQTDACSEYYHGNTTSAKISPTSHKK